MCGIAGSVGAPSSEMEGRLEVALGRLAHRGPDGSGIHRSPGALLGMRRLAIIDVAGGGQPIYNEDGSIAVVCNGEIYNYREEMDRLARLGHKFQSKSDVNVVPHGYEAEEGEAVHRWRGMFAVALWDDRRDRLVLWRDRVGKKPLYYWRSGSKLVFASELPALLALLDEPPAVDPAAVGMYLRYGYVPHPQTVYQGVAALPPGSMLTFDREGRLDLTRYWRRGRSPVPVPGDRNGAIQAIDEMIVEATRLRLRSDVPVGLFLSGGVDSGLVAAAAVRAGARDLVAFTVAVDDATLDESAAAEATGRHLGLDVERIELSLAPRDLVGRVATMYGQPFADSSAVPSYAVARAARRLRTVVLNGDGGDEVFAGYRRYQLGRWSRAGALAGRVGAPALRGLAAALARGPRRSAAGFARRALRGFAAEPMARFGLWTTDLFDADSIGRCFPGLSTAAELAEFPPGYDGLRAMLTADYERLLPDDLLVKMDIATMANGLEARSPLLDCQLADFVWCLPDRWLLGGSDTKPLLRTLAAKYLPAAVSTAPKRGFEVPVARWLDKDLRDLSRDVLLAPDARIRAWADDTALEQLVGGELAVAGNRPQMMWAVLMLELFLRDPLGVEAAAE
ncbi:MAG: asparagine synthase (glutamine-hydrolyzing) [Gemmatimonadales bacterium]